MAWGDVSWLSGRVGRAVRRVLGVGLGGLGAWLGGVGLRVGRAMRKVIGGGLVAWGLGLVALDCGWDGL